MTLFNMCLLKKWIIPILRSIECHRESFGSSSHVILHSFSTAGTMAICAMNEFISKHQSQAQLLYFDGVIYDSPYLGPLPIQNGVYRSWEAVKSQIISRFVCRDYDGCCCSMWYYVVATLCLVLFVVLFPLCFLMFTVYIAMSCSMDFVWRHDEKLLCSENPRILSGPMLLLGSNTDHINPVRRSMEFIRMKMEQIEHCKVMETRRADLMVNINANAMHEETTPLKPTLKAISESTSMFSINDYDSEFIQQSNGYFVFEDSGHVQHYQTYPKLYQKQINQFLDLCLKM